MSIENPPPKTLEPHIWAAIIWGCMLGGFFIFVSPIAGIIIAHVQREKLAATPFAGHVSAAIRTFWITTALFFAGLLVTIVAFVITAHDTASNDATAAAMFVLFFFGWILLGLWFLFRSGKGMILALNEVPWSSWAGIF